MFNPDEYVTRLSDYTKWYAVDLDGTLAEAVWKRSKGIGAPIEANVEKLRLVRRKGFKTVIHTSRPWSDYEGIERWLKDHRIPFDKIVCGKLLAHKYIDDKAINAEDDSWL